SRWTRGVIDRFQRQFPNLTLEFSGLVEQLTDSHDVGSGAIGLESGVEVFAKLVLQGASRRFGEKRDPEVRRADVVGFLDNQVAAMVKTTGGTRKRKRHHQSHQSEHRSVNGGEARRVTLRRAEVPGAQPLSRLHRE